MIKGYGFTVEQVCEIHRVSRQAYYQQRRRNGKEQAETEEVLRAVRTMRKKHPKLGVRKLHVMFHVMLKRLSIGRDKFFDLLRKHKLLVRRRRRRPVTTDSLHSHRIYGNWIKGRRPWRAAEIFQSDITYLRVGNGFTYASLVTDAFSRKIVGYSLCRSLSTDGPITALRQALKQRGRRKRPLIHHSDQGVQYCCRRYIKILNKHLAVISMSRKASPQDNALAERVNGILKHEYSLLDRFRTFQQAKLALSQAVWLYNNERPHTALGYRIPAQVHQQSLNQWT